ncbi:MAG: hypothetical protein K8F90_04165 [Hyphomicrobiales bacterium]|nr:hypothetical protein [Hyphomicrobiales bacterium]
MKQPQFAERQYETAAHIELARGQASPFVPTQPMEAYIGIDAAADPAKWHSIWRILSVHIPRRIQLSPSLWPSLPRQFHNHIPGRFCSLFMQFKRPKFQDNKKAKYHSQIGGPYFEVGITAHQQKSLMKLERRVRTGAVVRYASPAFWSRDDFDFHDERRQVLANSAFISPSRIKSHKKWMYSSPSGKAVMNPDPEEADGEAWESVTAEMIKLAARQSLREHVRTLANAVGDESDQSEKRGENNWLKRIARYGQFSDEDITFLIDLSVVARAAELADSTWVTMLLPEDGWKERLEDERNWMLRWPLWWW